MHGRMRSPFGIAGISHAAGVVLSVVGSARALAAQVIREPVLLFEPVVTINAASAPLPTGSSTGLNGESDRLYVNDLVIQGAALFPIGQKWMADLRSLWSRLTIYGIREQNLTPSRNATTQKVDRLNPTFLYGVSIPIWRARDSGHAP